MTRLSGNTIGRFKTCLSCQNSSNECSHEQLVNYLNTNDLYIRIVNLHTARTTQLRRLSNRFCRTSSPPLILEIWRYCFCLTLSNVIINSPFACCKMTLMTPLTIEQRLLFVLLFLFEWFPFLMISNLPNLGEVCNTRSKSSIALRILTTPTGFTGQSSVF